MKLSGVIDALIAAGGSVEHIQAVVRAAEAEQEAELANKRAKEACRKKAYREMVDAQKSRDVPGCPTDTKGRNGTDGDIPSLPPEKEPPTPQEKLTPPTPEDPRFPTETAPKGASRDRGASLPADWMPKQRHYDRAAEAGRDRRSVDNQAEAMREWAGANRNRQVGRKADWDLTFDGWLRRAIGDGMHTNGARAGPTQTRNKPPSMFDATIDFLAEIHDKPH